MKARNVGQTSHWIGGILVPPGGEVVSDVSDLALEVSRGRFVVVSDTPSDGLGGSHPPPTTDGQGAGSPPPVAPSSELERPSPTKRGRRG